jgi:transcriptional regulator with GAF, ATPase, and Fis domain
MATGVQRCLPFIAEAIPVDRIGIHLYEAGLGSLRTILMATREGVTELDILTPLSLAARRKLVDRDPLELLVVTRPGLETVAVRIFNRPALDPVMGEVLGHFGVSFDSSFLILRLQRGGEPLGRLVVGSDGRDRYTKEHARLLALLHEPFTIALANAMKHQEVLRLKEMLADENRHLRRELRGTTGEEPIGAKFGLKDVMEMVRYVAPLDSPVLLRGETGVGKDVIANAIHYSSPRREGPFIKVNCGAIPETLIDSELFGHERGAFTGASSQKRGFFERAHQGTIFLDEVGELPPAAQVRMLRVIQYREIQRVGGSASIPVNIRIIAATHRNLEEMVKAGQFREDLWFRLNVFPIIVPPLRSRRNDIPALTDYFIQKKSRELRLPGVPAIAPGAVDRLAAYEWPGNVRELENVIERALIVSRGEELRFDRFLSADREPETRGRDVSERPVGPLDEVLSGHIQRALQQTQGKIHGPGGAAELLGMNPSTLRSKMKRLHITYGRRQ